MSVRKEDDYVPPPKSDARTPAHGGQAVRTPKALTRTQAGRQCEIKEALFLDRMAAHWRLDQHRVYLCGGGPRNCG